MPFFPTEIARALAGNAELIDMHLRSQLDANFISNERDYCSSFAVLFRTLCAGLRIPNLDVSVVINNGSIETATGSDLRFVFCLDRKMYKVLLAEAKLFKPSAPNAWDRRVKNPPGPKVSHFDRQLSKQLAFPLFSFIEIFFVDSALGAAPLGLLPYGSSCFRLDDVVASRLGIVPALPGLPAWNGAELAAMSASKPKYSIGEAMYLTSICEWGEPTDYIGEELDYKVSIFIKFSRNEL